MKIWKGYVNDSSKEQKKKLIIISYMFKRSTSIYYEERGQQGCKRDNSDERGGKGISRSKN